ncbi:sporulation protein [Halorussus caseinilyticus]|uniref:Sporulation protein n=1 Tax=Halorussus caseinilyticus TaxID=3034025 RepID=A0ABD5WMF3_9EURY
MCGVGRNHEKVLASVGIGNASVDTVLSSTRVTPGE